MGIVKSECVHARACATRDEAALDIFERIEVVYNRARIHSALGYMSPAELEEANWPDDEGRVPSAVWDSAWDNFGTAEAAFKFFDQS